MTGISYFILHLLAMTLPGWVIVRLSGLHAARLIFVLASSYVYYVLLASLSKWLHLPLTTFLTLYILTPIILGAISLGFRAAPEKISHYKQWLTGLIVVVISYALYRYRVGPYTEVPADLFHHLEYAREQFNAIGKGYLGPQRDVLLILKQQGGIWYSFYALLSSFTGLELDQTLAWAMLANGLLFLSVVYSFAWYLVGYYKLSVCSRLGAALLATFFLASHLGLNVFSYIRYYSFAPTMLNMVIYFATMVAIFELLRWRTHALRYALFIPLGLVAAAAVHNQEALFILVMFGMMLGWYVFYPVRLDPAPVAQLKHPPVTTYRIALALFIAGFMAMVVWVYLHEDRPARFFNKIIQLSQQGPILNRILLLNPAFQGYQVITAWGLFVYALFILYWRKFIAHPYLFPGMLVPAVTVFNPVFVDWFMRMDGVHTLWRMLFIVPLHFVAGLLVIFLLTSVRQADSIWRKVAAGFSIIMLFLLLSPLGGLNPNARMTLAKVSVDNSYVYWQDLIDYLNQSQPEPVSILTDPVTGYVIKGLTRHRTYHFKFFNARRKPFNFDNYDDAPLAKYKGWLLVLNDRDGAISQTGLLGGHWPKSILKTSAFYRQALREHIAANPDGRFEEIWSNNNIYVYRIH